MSLSTITQTFRSRRLGQRRKMKTRKKLANLPRVNLAHLPTPLDACPKLAAHIGIHQLFIKREDCTGLAFGGNKVRQHEYVLGAAIASGSDCIIQGAASQSNHSRQIAAAGAKLGLDVFLTPKKDQNIENIQGNYLIDHLLGAEILPIDKSASSAAEKEGLAKSLIAKGRKPYISGMGATDSLILGAVACVETIFEISDALGVGIAPDWIFSASQGSTQAGLLLGCEILGWKTEVIGINPLSSDHEAYLSPEEILFLLHSAAKILNFETHIGIDRIKNDLNYVGEDYGVPSNASIGAIKLLASKEGILLDPIYSGKAFAGFLDYRVKGRIAETDTVVFIHTGGLPALFIHNQTIMNKLGSKV
jgi:L-cysteate sulfo-lyase